MSEINVRQATPSDTSALAHLITELGYPTSAAEIAARLEAFRDRRDYATFVADLGGVVAGMIGVSVSPSLYRSDLSGAIVALVVSSEFRDRGVGALLVNHGELWLLESGAKRATVNPSVARIGAHRFYRRLGYEHTGLRFTKTLRRVP